MKLQKSSIEKCNRISNKIKTRVNKKLNIQNERWVVKIVEK